MSGKPDKMLKGGGGGGELPAMHRHWLQCYYYHEHFHYHYHHHLILFFSKLAFLCDIFIPIVRQLHKSAGIDLLCQIYRH